MEQKLKDIKTRLLGNFNVGTLRNGETIHGADVYCVNAEVKIGQMREFLMLDLVDSQGRSFQGRVFDSTASAKSFESTLLSSSISYTSTYGYNLSTVAIYPNNTEDTMAELLALISIKVSVKNVPPSAIFRYIQAEYIAKAYAHTQELNEEYLLFKIFVLIAAKEMKAAFGVRHGVSQVLRQMNKLNAIPANMMQALCYSEDSLEDLLAVHIIASLEIAATYIDKVLE